ncbi:single-stranded-DNA-specific exonuclease RecJ [Dehalobacter sp. DCM]|uniref:single-stranded-DNA-specific exonuclease RecJ n=1 Tax=Dehalobacter sp. DCM TaxID=2907827 RepID=UPI0030812688|nr:single-stranded-DNA-specific exonuclease RecJ [Dehalobacter sp. DCM]
MKTNTWILSSEKVINASSLEKAGISHNVLHILQNRGYTTKKSILEFLRPSLFNLHSPFLFKDMMVILERLKMAYENQEKILVYGDYDADGVTGTALLYKGLTDLGFNIMVHIPSREQGYGLHTEAIDKAVQSSVSLIITVDCGISAVEETAYAKGKGIDFIITDHHEPPDILPHAIGILNPKVADSGYLFPHLAGVGVAFKLLQALLSYCEHFNPAQRQDIDYLDIVALGTIADIVPLIGENRILVRQGLLVMENTEHPGLRAILEECGLLDKKLKAGHISFIVAPRINAAGRMDTARLALNLLLEDNYSEAIEIAKALSKENYQRQMTEKELLDDAECMLSKGPIPDVIVLSSPDWHHGVIGIVASRLVERYKRPVFLIAEEGNKGKGSARGIPDYHVLEEVRKLADLFTQYGGHKQAAGFSLPVANIPLLRAGLNASFKNLGLTFLERFHVDSVLLWHAFDKNFLAELDEMAPFGAGNPAPILQSDGLAVRSLTVVGKGGEHLKLILEANKLRRQAMAFKKGPEYERLSSLQTIDMIYNLELNTYGNEENVQAVLKDYRPSLSSSASEIACSQEDEYDGKDTLMLRDHADADADDDDDEVLRVSRKMLVDFYKYLKSQVSEQGKLVWSPEGENKNVELQMSKIFEELGILSWLGGTDPYLLKLNTIEKTNLQMSLRFRLWSSE